MEWVEEQELRILYGVSLYREFLFIALRMNRKAPVFIIEEGVNTLDKLMESLVIRAKN